MKEFKHILFREEDHTYQNINTGTFYTSVTTKIKEYEPVFRSYYWAAYKTLQDQGYKKLIPDSAPYVPNDYIRADGINIHINDVNDVNLKLNEWDLKSKNALEKGNFIHQYMEMRAHRKIISVPEKFKVYQNVMESYFSKEKPETIATELIIGDDEINIAGQIDYLREPFWITDWKGLCLNTPIPTENGFKKMGKIQVGDVIFDGKGELTKVNNISKIHYKPCYKITFSDNQTIIADFEHKWEVIKGTEHKEKNLQLTTRDLYNHYQENKNKNKLKIKNCDFTKSKYKKLPIDPYVLGLWLGNGNSYCGRITCIYDSIWEEIKKRGYKLSKNLEKQVDKAPYRTLYGLETELRKLNLLKNKHIPSLYLRASYSQRLDLLRGFMDADGSLNETKKHFVMETTKEWQTKDLMKLVTSLGSSATIIKAKTSGFGKKNIDCFHINFLTRDFPFLCRNKNKYTKGLKYKMKTNYRFNHRYIKKVEKIKSVPTKCLTVESEDHTFLAGYSHIKTHNSDEKIKYENKYESFKYPFKNYDHTNFNKYCFQVNTYRYLFEKNTGKIIQGMEVVSITDKGYEIIPIPRIEEPIKKMLYDNRRINFKYTG